jgi:hypothetical protein
MARTTVIDLYDISDVARRGRPFEVEGDAIRG